MARPSSFDELLGNLNAELYGVGSNGSNGNGSNGNGEVRYCDCAETLDSKGRRVPVPPRHDCKYVSLRNALIPEAEKIANELGNGDPYEYTRIFVKALDDLCRATNVL
jgi:hypothetical protein